jgi:hypothetical protein
LALVLQNLVLWLNTQSKLNSVHGSSFAEGTKFILCGWCWSCPYYAPSNQQSNTCLFCFLVALEELPLEFLLVHRDLLPNRVVFQGGMPAIMCASGRAMSTRCHDTWSSGRPLTNQAPIEWRRHHRMQPKFTRHMLWPSKVFSLRVLFGSNDVWLTCSFWSFLYFFSFPRAAFYWWAMSYHVFMGLCWLKEKKMSYHVFMGLCLPKDQFCTMKNPTFLRGNAPLY